MMNTLEQLRKANPFPIYSVHDAEFTDYGRIVQNIDFTQALDYVATQLPKTEGTEYIASIPALEAMPCFQPVRDFLFGCADAQLGVCYGHNHFLNSLEYHKCNELNVSREGCVLLLARIGDMENGVLDSSHVKAFYLPAGQAVELYQATLHFAPCACSDEGFFTLIGLPRGTNAPLPEDRLKRTDGKDHLLTAVNKWQYDFSADAGTPGNPYGIKGENLQVKY